MLKKRHRISFLSVATATALKTEKLKIFPQIQLQTRILLETKRSPCVGNCKNLHSWWHSWADCEREIFLMKYLNLFVLYFLKYFKANKNKKYKLFNFFCKICYFCENAWLQFSYYLLFSQQKYKEMIYTPWVKKQDTKPLPITSPNINRFSNFLHC